MLIFLFPMISTAQNRKQVVDLGIKKVTAITKSPATINTVISEFDRKGNLIKETRIYESAIPNDVKRWTTTEEMLYRDTFLIRTISVEEDSAQSHSDTVTYDYLTDAAQRITHAFSYDYHSLQMFHYNHWGLVDTMREYTNQSFPLIDSNGNPMVDVSHIRPTFEHIYTYDDGKKMISEQMAWAVKGSKHLWKRSYTYKPDTVIESSVKYVNGHETHRNNNYKYFRDHFLKVENEFETEETNFKKNKDGLLLSTTKTLIQVGYGKLNATTNYTYEFY